MSTRTRAAYCPDRGDICAFDLDPAKATKEIGKYRPCLVLTRRDYNESTRLCVIVPISSNESRDPLYVQLPDRLLREPSQALCDRVRSLSWVARQCEFIVKAPPDFLDEVVATMLDLIDPRA